MNILKSKKKRDNKPVTGGRKWLFRFILIGVIPALLLLMVEFGLYIVGYGFPASFTSKYMWKGQPAFCDNNKFTWQFFPKSIAREVDPFIFLEKKPTDSYRIFIMGGSAAQGIPDPAFNFGRILQVMLQEAYPKINFEIINTAITAINSHVVLEITKDLVKHNGDLFIIYMGNNEVVGPYGAGTIFSPISPSLSLIRLGIFLKTTKLGQLYFNALQSIRTKKNAQKSWRGLEMFLNKQVRANDPRLEFVYKHFQKNLEDICSIVLKKGKKIILSTVGSNLKDSPPFTSQHRKGIPEVELKKWTRLYQEAIGLMSAGNYVDAIDLFKSAAKIDNSFAELHFRFGRCLWMMGDFEKARLRFIKAREFDTLRFRADIRINQIIRQIANNKDKKHILLADAVKEFKKNSPHQIPGEELFYEHVHLKFRGNYLLAQTICKQVEQVLPVWIKKTGYLDNSPLTEAACAARLAYTGWDRFNLAYSVLYNYIKKPPYSHQLFHTERVCRMEKNLKQLNDFLRPESLEKSSEIYRKAIEKGPLDWRLRIKYAKLLLIDLKDFKKAANQYRLVQNLLPHSYFGYAGLGVVLMRQGQLDEAVTMYHKAININPYKMDIQTNLGLTYQMKGEWGKAEEFYSRAISNQPHFIPAYQRLGLLFGERGNLDDGIVILRKGLTLNPKSWRLHHTLGILLNKRGDQKAAIQELTIALKIDPEAKKSRELLNRILREKANF